MKLNHRVILIPNFFGLCIIIIIIIIIIKYGPLCWELEQRFPDHHVTQYNIIVDLLRGYSRGVRKALRELVGDKSDTIALQILKSVITSLLNIAKSFKFLNRGY